MDNKEMVIKAINENIDNEKGNIDKIKLTQSNGNKCKAVFGKRGTGTVVSMADNKVMIGVNSKFLWTTGKVEVVDSANNKLEVEKKNGKITFETKENETYDITVTHRLNFLLIILLGLLLVALIIGAMIEFNAPNATTMKKLIAMALCLVLALSMVGCSNSANKTETISFHDKTFNKADLSPETLNWLIQYNKLSEEEQLAISFIPSDLYELCGYENAIEEVGSTEAQPGGTPVEEAFDITVSYANWTEDSAIYVRALNTNKMALSSVLHLPIYKFSTLEELEKFKLDFGEVLAMDSGYDEVPSFNDVTANYDETFFNENALMLVYAGVSSGSYRFGVNSVFCNGNSFCIHIEQLNNPEVGTADMAGWFITVAVPNSMVANCSEFDADLNNIEN